MNSRTNARLPRKSICFLYAGRLGAVAMLLGLSCSTARGTDTSHLGASPLESSTSGEVIFPDASPQLFDNGVPESLDLGTPLSPSNDPLLSHDSIRAPEEPTGRDLLPKLFSSVSSDLEQGELTPDVGPPCAASELWLISTRNSPCRDCLRVCEFEPEVERCQPQVGWHAASLSEFLTANSQLPIVIYLHGNDASDATARDSGRELFERLQGFQASPACRFVIWSWPSDRVYRGIRKDVLAKAGYTPIESWYLANFVGNLPFAVQVNLIGYSFGARVATGALHLLGGGELAERRLEGPLSTERLPFRVALLAPAIDNHWLLPGNYHGCALQHVERLLVTVNPEDWILHWYPKLSGGPPALGYTGLAGTNLLGPLTEKIRQVDVAGMVGVKHNYKDYVRSPTIIAWLRETTLDAR